MRPSIIAFQDFPIFYSCAYILYTLNVIKFHVHIEIDSALIFSITILNFHSLTKLLTSLHL